MNREMKLKVLQKFADDNDFSLAGYERINSKGDWEYCRNGRTDYVLGVITDNQGNAVFKRLQFTGLHDKNGVEIYEKDIVNDDELGVGLVVHQSGCFFMMYDADTNMEFLGLKNDKFGRLQQKRIVEIIGNVYQNPELLK